MLLIINKTSNVEFTILPKFKHERNNKFWYFECKWLGIQSTLYSKELGDLITKIFNDSTKK